MNAVAEGTFYLDAQRHIFQVFRCYDRCSDSNDDNLMFETPCLPRSVGEADSNQMGAFLLFVAFDRLSDFPSIFFHGLPVPLWAA